MTVPTRSYLKVPYDLRTAKQVERRMMIDGLRILSAAGLPISDYRYTGFGSVHFVDFVMFHKLLGVQKLTSVEYDDRIEKRINFNKPYSCVDVMIKPIGDVIPTLSRDEKHVLWLDYDDIVNEGQLEDVWQAAGTLSVGSILMVTVDVEPPNGTETPLQWKAYYEDIAATYLGDRPVEQYTRRQLAGVNVAILSRALEAGAAGRKGIDIIPVFNFLYKDGHEMLTLGCVIGTDAEGRQVRESRLDEQVYYCDDFSKDPYRIRVPIITRKERHYLDKAMPCLDGWIPQDFEMNSEDVLLYREVYRFLPAYAELLL